MWLTLLTLFDELIDALNVNEGFVRLNLCCSDLDFQILLLNFRSGYFNVFLSPFAIFSQIVAAWLQGRKKTLLYFDPHPHRSCRQNICNRCFRLRMRFSVVALNCFPIIQTSICSE